MDPMTIGMLVLSGLLAAQHVRDVLVSWWSGKPVAPPTPADPTAPPTHPLLHGLLQQVLAAAKAGKLTGDHPLLALLEAVLASPAK